MMSQLQDFMPHGMCLLWRPELMLLHIASDALIAAAYFAIPFGIARFVRLRRDLEQEHRATALLFAAFIALCGLTHLASILVLWVPLYVWEGWLKALTAVVSVATAFLLVSLVPQLLKIPSSTALQQEVLAHQHTIAALKSAQAALAARVGETESELNDALEKEQLSNSLLRTIVESAPGLVYAKDRRGRMLLANNGALDLIGKPWADVQGKRDVEFLSDPRQGEAVMANDRLVMSGDAVQAIEEIVDHPTKGKRVWFSTKTPMHDLTGAVTGLVGVSIDVTEQKQMQANLLHVSRLSAMGEMAAALAHELNQPLAAITNYVAGSRQVIARENPASEVVAPLDRAIEQTLRAGQIIRRIRAFVSNEDMARHPEDLRELVSEACSLALVGAALQAIETRVRQDERPVMVVADKVQIEQVIHNLTRNAIEALAETQEPRLEISVRAGEDEMALISIVDNGPGVSETVADRLFQPFVSTKGTQGMGIGLSICRSIVEAHGGKIWMAPQDEGGSGFFFTLPLAPRPDGAT